MDDLPRNLHIPKSAADLTRLWQVHDHCFVIRPCLFCFEARSLARPTGTLPRKLGHKHDKRRSISDKTYDHKMYKMCGVTTCEQRRVKPVAKTSPSKFQIFSYYCLQDLQITRFLSNGLKLIYVKQSQQKLDAKPEKMVSAEGYIFWGRTVQFLVPLLVSIRIPQ